MLQWLQVGQVSTYSPKRRSPATHSRSLCRGKADWRGNAVQLVIKRRSTRGKWLSVQLKTDEVIFLIKSVKSKSWTPLSFLQFFLILYPHLQKCQCFSVVDFWTKAFSSCARHCFVRSQWRSFWHSFKVMSQRHCFSFLSIPSVCKFTKNLRL